MIDDAMKFLKDELNVYLQSREPADDHHAVLATPARADGVSSADTADKLIITLINIEPGAIAVSPGPQFRTEVGNMVRSKQPLTMSLLLLISANYPDNYQHNLKMLSLALEYFQTHA